jgi:hypothetical protein
MAVQFFTLAFWFVLLQTVSKYFSQVFLQNPYGHPQDPESLSEQAALSTQRYVPEY